jgi:hypothetical protein
MSDRMDRRTFVAHDDVGGRYVLVAERPLGPNPAQDRPGSWAYRTADGRCVRPAAVYHQYQVEPAGPHLTTTDPDEPAD